MELLYKSYSQLSDLFLGLLYFQGDRYNIHSQLEHCKSQKYYYNNVRPVHRFLGFLHLAGCGAFNLNSLSLYRENERAVTIYLNSFVCYKTIAVVRYDR